MTADRLVLTALIAMLAAGCGSEDDDPTLNHYGEELTESVTAVAQSMSSHHEEILAATDLARMQHMEQMHMEDMAMRIGRMQDAHESMEICAEHMAMTGHEDGGQAFHDARTAMGETMADASAEIEHHIQAMQEAADADSALAEEHRHQSEMDRNLDRMRMHDGELAHAMQAMEEAGMSMMCTMDSHMHRQH